MFYCSQRVVWGGNCHAGDSSRDGNREDGNKPTPLTIAAGCYTSLLEAVIKQLHRKTNTHFRISCHILDQWLLTYMLNYCYELILEIMISVN